MELEAVRRAVIPGTLSHILKNWPTTKSAESLVLLTLPSHKHSNKALSYMTDELSENTHRQKKKKNGKKTQQDLMPCMFFETQKYKENELSYIFEKIRHF